MIPAIKKRINKIGMKLQATPFILFKNSFTLSSYKRHLYDITIYYCNTLFKLCKSKAYFYMFLKIILVFSETLLFT